MRLEVSEIAARQIKRQQVTQAAVERIEIQARAVRGDGSRGMIGIAGERCLACARIHGGPRRKISQTILSPSLSRVQPYRPGCGRTAVSISPCDFAVASDRSDRARIVRNNI